jgi:hypothetical protein
MRYSGIFLIAAAGMYSANAQVAAPIPHPTPDVGRVDWGQGYPKVVHPVFAKSKGFIDLGGTYEIRPGWKITKAVFYHTPAEGGRASAHIELKFVNGKWGTVYPWDRSVVIPARIPMDVGKWTLWVLFTFEGKDKTGKPLTIPWMMALRTVEVRELAKIF